MTKSAPQHSIVLYADDDTDDLQLIEEAFYNYANNIEVVTATDGVKALSYLEGLTKFDPLPCLIILDINMPRLSGKEVLKELRKTDLFKDTPVVLFSTSSLQQDKEYALKYNAGFITKPIDVRQIEVITGEFITHCSEDVQKKIRKEIS